MIHEDKAWATSPDYLYDAAGNMTCNIAGSATPEAYTYDAENRIMGAAAFTYKYDADGDRVEKVNGSTGTIYWYMAPGVVAESDLSGNLQSEYIFFDGERVARKDFPSNAVSYYFSDNLRTASVITDSAGNIKEDEDYYPWGGELQFVNNDSNHYKFTGKERDPETGLDYFGARYYSNPLGRFLSADWSAKPEEVPYADLHDPQSLNLYSYVRNIPTVDADADGHQVLEEGGYVPDNPHRVIDCTVETTRCQIIHQQQILDAENAEDQAKRNAVAGATIPLRLAVPASGATTAGTTIATIAGTVAAGAAVVGSAYLFFTRLADTLVANAQDREHVAAIESTIAADNVVLLAANTAQKQKVINGLLNTAREHAGKINGNPPEDPNQSKWRKEVKAALDRARIVANRLPGSLKDAAMQTIKSIEGSIPPQ